MRRLEIQALRRMHVLTDAVLVSLGWLAAYGLRYALNDPLGRPINPFSWYVRSLPLVVGRGSSPAGCSGSTPASA